MTWVVRESDIEERVGSASSHGKQRSPSQNGRTMTSETGAGLPQPQPQVCQFDPLAGEVCITNQELSHDEAKGASPSNEKGAPGKQQDSVALSPHVFKEAGDGHSFEPRLGVIYWVSTNESASQTYK